MPSGSQNALFDRGEAGERAAVAAADNSAVEHTTLPEAARRERDLTLTLSFAEALVNGEPDAVVVATPAAIIDRLARAAPSRSSQGSR